MSLYDLLVQMNTTTKSEKPPIASTQARWVINVLNDNIGEELETADIAHQAGLSADSCLKILARLTKNYCVTSKMQTAKRAKNQTRVRLWTAHERIVPRQAA